MLCVPEQDTAEQMCPARNMVPVKFGDCFTCCAKKEEGIQALSLGDDDWVNPPHSDICLRAIFLKEDALERCTGDWVPVSIGDGYFTCCRKPEPEELTISAPKSKSGVTRLGDDDWVNPPHTALCLRAFFPKEVALEKCRGDMVPVKLGEGIFTCCEKAPETLEPVRTRSGSTSQEKLPGVSRFGDEDWVNQPHRNVCLLIYIPNKEVALQTCKGNLVPVYEDGAWACCLKADSEAMTLEL